MQLPAAVMKVQAKHLRQVAVRKAKQIAAPRILAIQNLSHANAPAGVAIVRYLMHLLSRPIRPWKSISLLLLRHGAILSSLVKAQRETLWQVPLPPTR